MILLIAGILLWSVAHYFKRLAPEMRNALDDKAGANVARGIMSIVIVVSVALMVFGYRATPENLVYSTPDWGRYVNNMMMLAAVALMGMGSSKGRARTWLRHPMLTGVLVWAAAHLLVSGELSAIILFGGISVWAVISMALANTQDGPWERPEPGAISGDIKWIAIHILVFAVFAGIHTLVGPSPFGG